MEGMKRLQIPAFGNWEDCDQMPITQHFESAIQAGLIKGAFREDEDLFKIPVASTKPTHQRKVKNGEINMQGIRVHDLTTKSPRRQHKAVDEDLYKIPRERLYQKPKRDLCLGSSCVACA